MTRALILAGGGRTGLRWPAPPGVVPRHMVPIRGEPMIHRTTRMLAERGIEDIRVFADPSDTDYIIAPAVHEHPRVPERPGRTFVQEWEPSMHRWPDEGRCMILYGDVYFSDALMDAMVADDGDPWNVYARYGASTHHDKEYGEIVGAHIVGNSACDMIAELVAVMALEGGIQELQRIMHPHPTISEAVLDAARAVDKWATHA